MKEERSIRRKPLFISRYFIKMMISYCLVIVIGLGLAAAFTTSWVVGTLTDKEIRMDVELVNQARAYSDSKYRSIQNIFARLYMPLSYYGNYSIMDFLNPRRAQILDRKTKREVVSGYIQDVCRTSDFISDMFIVDYSDRNVFFYSNIAGRDTSLNYDFFSDSLIGAEVNNRIRIIPNNIPEYINSNSVNNIPVISYCIYLFDKNAVKFEKPLGYIVINVWADFFKGAFYDNETLNGTLYVVNGEGFTLFDSDGKLTGQHFDTEVYGIDDPDTAESNDKYIINIRHSEKTDYRFLIVTDRATIQKEAAKMQRSLLGVLIACILLAVVISLLSAHLFSSRIRRLVQKMRALERGEFNAFTEVRSNDEIGYLEQSYNKMITRLEKHIQTAYVYQLQSKTAELKALQAQINPHFLFNTLESIRVNALIHKDEDTAKMIHILGNLFRWNIKTRDMFVQLRQEIEYAGAFIELEKIRYTDAFDVSIEVPQSLLGLGVPKFILQPLVENAIRHGQQGVSSGGLIRITALEDGEGNLEIAVTDNGCGMDEDTVRRIVAGLDEPESKPDDSYSIGLSNVHQRIRILFGEPYGLSIESELGVKTVVRITMPAREKEELETYVQSNPC